MTAVEAELSADQIEKIDQFIAQYQQLQTNGNGGMFSEDVIASRITTLVAELNNLKHISNKLKTPDMKILSKRAEVNLEFLSKVKECHAIIRDTEQKIMLKNINKQIMILIDQGVTSVQLRKLLAQIQTLSNSVDLGQ
jgi:hypothetical protein